MSSTSQLFLHRAKLGTDKTKANEHGWVTVKTYWNLIIIEFPGALTYSSSFDFFQLLRSMKTLLSALPIQNHPKLPKHKQPTGTHKAPLCKVLSSPKSHITSPGHNVWPGRLAGGGRFYWSFFTVWQWASHYRGDIQGWDEQVRVPGRKECSTPHSCRQCPWRMTTVTGLLICQTRFPWIVDDINEHLCKSSLYCMPRNNLHPDSSN